MQSIIDTMITRLVQDLDITIEILQIAHETKTIKEAQTIISSARKMAEATRNHIASTLEEANREVRPVLLETNGIWDTIPCLIGDLTPSSFTAHYATNMNIKADVMDVTNVRFLNYNENTSHLERVGHLVA